MQYKNESLRIRGGIAVAPFASHHQRRNPWADARRAVHNWALAIVNWFATCAARHQHRVVVARLDDHLLSDIGKSRQEVAFEAAKPFWRK
jgi:uncharacterized protein YjiS (DUF1127 family)